MKPVRPLPRFPPAPAPHPPLDQFRRSAEAPQSPLHWLPERSTTPRATAPRRAQTPAACLRHQPSPRLLPEALRANRRPRFLHRVTPSLPESPARKLPSAGRRAAALAAVRPKDSLMAGNSPDRERPPPPARAAHSGRTVPLFLPQTGPPVPGSRPLTQPACSPRPTSAHPRAPSSYLRLPPERLRGTQEAPVPPSRHSLRHPAPETPDREPSPPVSASLSQPAPLPPAETPPTLSAAAPHPPESPPSPAPSRPAAAQAPLPSERRSPMHSASPLRAAETSDSGALRFESHRRLHARLVPRRHIDARDVPVAQMRAGRQTECIRPQASR